MPDRSCATEKPDLFSFWPRAATTKRGYQPEFSSALRTAAEVKP
jgi:hypothetical protein